MLDGLLVVLELRKKNLSDLLLRIPGARLVPRDARVGSELLDRVFILRQKISLRGRRSQKSLLPELTVRVAPRHFLELRDRSRVVAIGPELFSEDVLVLYAIGAAGGGEGEGEGKRRKKDDC